MYPTVFFVSFALRPGCFAQQKTPPPQKDSVTMAASGLMAYLSSSLLSERLLPVAIWNGLAPVTLGRHDATAGTGGSGGSQLVGQRMVLDATALAAIEVVETLEGGVASRVGVFFVFGEGWGCWKVEKYHLTVDSFKR